MDSEEVLPSFFIRHSEIEIFRLLKIKLGKQKCADILRFAIVLGRLSVCVSALILSYFFGMCRGAHIVRSHRRVNGRTRNSCAPAHSDGAGIASMPSFYVSAELGLRAIRSAGVGEIEKWRTAGEFCCLELPPSCELRAASCWRCERRSVCALVFRNLHKYVHPARRGV